jgi:hypothetical protein
MALSREQGDHRPGAEQYRLVGHPALGVEPEDVDFLHRMTLHHAGPVLDQLLASR